MPASELAAMPIFDGSHRPAPTKAKYFGDIGTLDNSRAASIAASSLAGIIGPAALKYFEAQFVALFRFTVENSLLRNRKCAL